MTWIEEYRTARELTRAEMAAVCRISEELVYILEEWRGAVTHPKLASRIALALGATAEQRDAIVNEIHRGKWLPKPTSKWARRMAEYLAEREKKRKRAENAEREAARAGELAKLYNPKGSPPARQVVAVNARGREVSRYRSAKDAAEAEGLSDTTIKYRCNRQMTGGEFVRGRKATYRWADEWDAMTIAQRADDVHAGDPEAQRSRTSVCRAVVHVTRDGRTMGRYNSIDAAATATGWSVKKIYTRVRKTVRREFEYIGETFRYADEWDAMTPEQRQAEMTGR